MLIDMLNHWNRISSAIRTSPCSVLWRNTQWDDMDRE